MNREEELVQVDRYLDALLATRFEIRDAAEPNVDEELRRAAGAVQRALPRFHPSFAFEERLARRFRAAPASPGTVIAFVPSSDTTAAVGAVVGEAVVGRQPWRPAVLLGSAIASGVSIAGVSIAGAALIARRRGKSTVTALSR
jgi:hypothetical protein